MAKLLLERGADPNFANEYGATPLHRAAEQSNAEMAKLLLEGGANVNAPANDGTTPLHRAVNPGNTELSKLLVEAGADVNAVDTWGYTPLHEAVKSGADPKIADKHGKTALSLAEKNGKAKIVEYLKSKM